MGRRDVRGGTRSAHNQLGGEVPPRNRDDRNKKRTRQSTITDTHCSGLTLWLAPTRPVALFLLATRIPGRPMTTKKSIPKIPIPGSYLIPKSMCSSIPKPKFPVSEKFLRCQRGHSKSSASRAIGDYENPNTAANHSEKGEALILFDLGGFGVPCPVSLANLATLGLPSIPDGSPRLITIHLLLVQSSTIQKSETSLTASSTRTP